MYNISRSRLLKSNMKGLIKLNKEKALTFENVKNLKLGNRVKKTMAFLTMSGVMALTGCSIFHDEHSNEKEIRIIYEEGEQKQDLENGKNPEHFVEEARIFEITPASDEAKVSDKDSYFEMIDLSFYDGYSLEEALRLGGYKYSYSAREELAEYLEIENYRGTRDEDLLILEKLGAKITFKQKKMALENEKNCEAVIVQEQPEIAQAQPQIGNHEVEEKSSSSKKHHTSSSKPNGNPSDDTKPVTHTHRLSTLKETDSEFEYWVCDEDNEITKIAHCFSVEFNSDDHTDVFTCENKGCDYTETREHVHSDVPENLEYVFKTSNHDGTHTMEASYFCNICNENVVLQENEECKYGEETYRIFSTYNSYNQHDVVQTCDVCGDEKVTRGDCVKTGDLQFIKIGSYIYEYYNCELCHGYVDRKQHTDHVFGEWEIDDNRHIRYCGCIEGREEGEHVFTFNDENVATCGVCGYSKVTDHEHAKNGMDYMDLVTNYFSDLLDYSPVPNPNPSPDDFCYSFRLRCSKCHTTYLITYEHEYGADGVCTLGKCDVVNPEYSPNAIENHAGDIQLMALQETAEEVQQISEDAQPVELVDTTLEDIQPTESIDTIPEDIQSTESTENNLDENPEIILEPLEIVLEEEVASDAIENTSEEVPEIVFETFEIEPVDEEVEEEHQKVLVLQ